MFIKICCYETAQWRIAVHEMCTVYDVPHSMRSFDIRSFAERLLVEFLFPAIFTCLYL